MDIRESATNILRALNTLELPAILCIAAIIGSITNAIAFAKARAELSAPATTTAEFLIIVPASPQKQVSLPLPDKTTALN